MLVLIGRTSYNNLQVLYYRTFIIKNIFIRVQGRLSSISPEERGGQTKMDIIRVEFYSEACD